MIIMGVTGVSTAEQQPNVQCALFLIKLARDDKCALHRPAAI